MSGILNREIRFEYVHGKYRRFPWNVVNTSLGGCWEPVNIKNYEPGVTMDVNAEGDQINKVSFDGDFKNPYFRDGGVAIMGGYTFLGLGRAPDPISKVPGE